MSGTSDWGVQSAIEHCRVLCRREARNFYYGLRLSPEPQRSALFVIYAWMRAADDLVDGADGVDAAALRERIERFRRLTEQALDGDPSGEDPMWLGLAHVAQQYPLGPEYFQSMLDGQLDDVSKHEYATFAELSTYCYRVASTVGLICIEIWGYDDAEARQLAIERGVAFQLTNIIRDFREDHDAGRVYLPREDFERHGITPRDLREWSNPNASEAMLRQQIARAQSYYDRSAGLDQLIAPACRPTLWAMTSIYRGLLRKAERDPSRLVRSRRLRLSALRKAAIALRAQMMARLGRGGPSIAAISHGVAGNSAAR